MITETVRRQCEVRRQADLNDASVVDKYILYYESRVLMALEKVKPLLKRPLPEGTRDHEIWHHVCPCNNCQNLYYEATSRLSANRNSMWEWRRRLENIKQGVRNELPGREFDLD